jgi:putative permease
MSDSMSSSVSLRRVAWFVALMLLTLTGLLLLWQFRAVVGLFAVSLAVGAALRPPIDYLASHRVPRGLAMLLTYLLALSVIGGLLYLMSGPLVAEIQQASNVLASSYERIKTDWPSQGLLLQLVAQRLPPSNELYANIAGQQGTALVGSLLGVTVSFFDLVSKVALVIVLSIYWGADQVHFERLWLSVLPAEQRLRARAIWRSIEVGVGAYIRSEVVQSVLAGVLLGLGFWAMGLHYPAALAFAGALTWLIPLVGGALAIVPVLLVGLANDPALALGAAMYTAIIFAILEWLVEPRLFNRRRYNSILVVFTMIAMADAMGVFGLLLAPPLAAAIQIFYDQLSAAPQVSTVTQTLPQIGQLRERLAAARALLDEMGEEALPETASMVARLEELIDDANKALQDDEERRVPPAERARRLALAGK